jgi:hypothetical protein
MVFAGMAGAGGLLVAGQLGAANVDQLINDEMGLSDPLLKTAAAAANTALGSGGDVSFTVLAVAAMPVVFHVFKSLSAMAKDEHELSIAKRKRALGLDGKTEAE